MNETKDKAAGTDVTALTQLQQDIREADAAVTARLERDGKELAAMREAISDAIDDLDVDQFRPSDWWRDRARMVVRRLRAVYDPNAEHAPTRETQL